MCACMHLKPSMHSCNFSPTSIVKNALEEHLSHRRSARGSVRIKEYLILTFHYIHTSVRHPLFNSIFAPLIRKHSHHLSYHPSNNLKAPRVANSPSNTNKQAILAKRQSKCKLSAAIMQEEKAVSKRHSSSNAPNRPRKNITRSERVKGDQTFLTTRSRSPPLSRPLVTVAVL